MIRRRQDKAVAWEGWEERKESLQNFLPASSQQGLSQFSAIEWSSSDEEEEENRKVTPRIRKIQVVAETSASKSLCSPDFDLSTYKAVNPPCKRKRGDEMPKAENNLNCPLSPPVARRIAMARSHHGNVKSGESSTQVGVSMVCQLETPKKERYSDEVLDSSPIVGSQRHPRRKMSLETQDVIEIPSSMNIIEPGSPILGSQIVVKRRRSSLGLRTCAATTEITRSAVCQSKFKRRTMQENAGSSKLAKATKLNFSNTGDASDAAKKEFDIKKLVINHNSDWMKLLKQRIKEKDEHEINVENIDRLSKSRTSLDRLKKNECEKENMQDKTVISIEHIDSQETGQITEEVENSLEVGIISSSSSSDTDQERTLESIESHNAAISEVSSVPTQPEEATAQTLKTGSEWLRSLQQVTPVKQSAGGSNEVAEEGESAKKKMKKDGLASRLSRLIRSWESGIQMWSHQMNITSLQGQPSQHPQINSNKKEICPVTDGSKLSSPLVRAFPLKTCQSPGVRNLNMLLSSPSSVSSVHSSPFWGSLADAPKKHLQLKIISIGGTLPNNAALCMEINYKSNLQMKGSGVKKDADAIKVEGVENDRSFVVIFALSELSQKKTLQVNSFVKVYTPWQHLDVPQYSIPVLFTSFFVIEDKPRDNHLETNSNIKEEKLSCNKKKNLKRTILLSRTCQCPLGAIRVPSVCSTHQQTTNLHKRIRNQSMQEANPGFSVIKDSSEKLRTKGEDYTTNSILKAIEKCGGVSDMPVAITVRVHRIITRGTGSLVDEWECVCQDARGMFCTVKIPNHPLVSQFKQLIETGEGSTFTFTHVTVLQRLTNTQNAGLFSLLSSLHAAYQSAIRADPDLCLQLKEHISRPPQTYCYGFVMNLKVSRAVDNKQHVVLPIKLPDWSLKMSLQIMEDGKRGNVKAHILYKVSSLLFVMSENQFSEAENLGETAKENGKNVKHNMGKGSTLVTRIAIDREMSLPSWILKSGTVMHSAVLRDVAVWQGKLVIDAYSKIEKMESTTDVTLTALNKILKPLSATSKCWDLIVLTGTILLIDEENAYSWPNCCHCLDSNISETEDGAIECQNCGKISSSAGTGYCLEVWIDCGASLRSVKVKVKLYQRTIERLLRSSNNDADEETYDEGYDPDILIGKYVGPLVCVVQEIRKPKSSQPQSFKLLQLPY